MPLKVFYIAVLSLLTGFSCIAQVRDCTMRIVVKNNVYNFTASGLNDTIKLPISNDTAHRTDYIKLVVDSCHGNIHMFYYLKNTVRIRGDYIYNHDSVFVDSLFTTGADGRMTTVTARGLRPVKEGTWYYYDSTSSVVSEEHWRKGQLKGVSHLIKKHETHELY